MFADILFLQKLNFSGAFEGVVDAAIHVVAATLALIAVSTSVLATELGACLPVQAVYRPLQDSTARREGARLLVTAPVPAQVTVSSLTAVQSPPSPSPWQDLCKWCWQHRALLVACSVAAVAVDVGAEMYNENVQMTIWANVAVLWKFTMSRMLVLFCCLYVFCLLFEYMMVPMVEASLPELAVPLEVYQASNRTRGSARGPPCSRRM